MNTLLSSRKSRIVAVCVAFALALTLRVVAYVDLGHDLAVRMPILDGRWSLDQASQLIGGHGWGEHPFFMAPLYPHLLAPLVALSSEPVAQARVLQLAVGLLTWILVVLLAWKRIGSGAAVAAGWLLALAAPPILYENLLLVDPWLSLLLVLLLWLDPAEGGRKHALLAGALAALAALGRASYLLLGPIVWLRIILCQREETDPRAKTKRGSSRRILLASSVAAWVVVMAPVALQNALTGAPGAVVSTNGGLNLYLGFHEGSRGGFSMPPDLLIQEDPTGQRAATLMMGREVTTDEASRFWMRKALGWIYENPGRAVLLELRKLGLWLGSREQPQIEVFPVLRTRHPILRWAPLHFGWLVALGGLGLFMEARRDRFWRRWGFWLGILLVCWLTSMVTFAVGRFRLPAWALLSLPAGAAVASLVGYARRGQAKRLLLALAALALALLMTEVMPRADFGQAAAHFHHSLAQRHLAVGEPQNALEELERAQSLGADLPILYHTRGVALARLGRRDEAIQSYHRALSRLGPFPKTLQNLGALYGQQGRHAEALRYLQEAARYRPDDPVLLTDLGVAFWENRRYDQAREAWRQALRLDPHDARVRGLLEMPTPSE